jgi:hypothetical protein
MLEVRSFGQNNTKAIQVMPKEILLDFIFSYLRLSLVHLF